MDWTSDTKVSIKLPAVKNGLEARACGLLSLKMHLGVHHVSEGRIQSHMMGRYFDSFKKQFYYYFLTGNAFTVEEVNNQ